MFDYMEYYLQRYFEKAGWKQDQLYSNLCRSSIDILDFRIPEGLNILASHKSTDNLKNSISGFGAPSKLKGSVGFLYTSHPLSVPESNFALNNQLMDNFHKYYGRTSITKDPLNSPEHLSSTKSHLSDYLLYGHVYLPRCRLEALFTQKISNTLQYIISGVSIPYDQDRSHLSFQLQQEGRRSCTEYSYTTDDCLIGVRSLYRLNEPDDLLETLATKDLKPYWALGGEIYYSASTKIGGVSFGLRRQNPVSTPSDITLTINPVMGHLSSAYTALMSSNLTASTRYNFNVYSLESDYMLGIEWRNRREGLIKARVSLLQGAALLFSSRYRQLTFTLGLNIASPTSSSPGSSPRTPNPHTMLRSMGIQIQYSS